MTPSDRLGRGSNVVSGLGVVAVIGVATAVLLGLGADVAVAALTLLAGVVIAALFGRRFAAIGVVLAYLALNWWFTDPTGTLAVDKIEDFVPLLAFAISATACAWASDRGDVHAVTAVGAVGIVSALLVVTDADLVTAALVLLGVVVLIAVMGIPAAVTAVAASYLALNFWFTRPIGSLEITKVQDLVPLLAFTLAAGASAGTIARIEFLRKQAATIEQREFDARLAQASSESRAGFLTSMTHNLRTPLATIKASLSALLATPEVDPGQRELLLSNARAETDRLDRLVTKVLQLSRIHAGALEPEVEPVDLGELTGNAVRRLHRLAEDHDLHVVVTTDDLVFAVVDPDMIEIVLTVMLENAFRFAPSGSRIDVVVAAPAADNVLVRVIDRGPGIPEEARETVFEEFVQLDRTRASSGLGLTIARSMVEANRGRIWVEETPGGGATVAVSLPAIAAPDAP